jgi:two-component system nitrate/nitrite response regulator NarL
MEKGLSVIGVMCLMNIVVVDDHPLVRKGISMVLSLENDLNICSEATTVEEALEAISKTDPDLVLLDLRLVEGSGLDVVKKTREIGVSCKFIVLTSSSTVEDFLKAEEVGIDGYVLKEALPEELLYAIRLVSRGRKYYDPALLELKMKEAADDPINELTPREQDVLMALGEGLPNRQIAQRLFITEYTVKKHVSQILSKLELADRTQAALFANSKGLVSFR